MPPLASAWRGGAPLLVEVAWLYVASRSLLPTVAWDVDLLRLEHFGLLASVSSEHHDELHELGVLHGLVLVVPVLPHGLVLLVLVLQFPSLLA